MRKLRDIHADRVKAEADDRDTRSRSDARTERISAADHLMALGKALCELPEKQLRRLELPERVADAVAEARFIESPAARTRQMKIVRRELRLVDADGIERALDELVRPAHVTAKPPKVDRVLELYERLRAGGNDAVFAFCAEHPDLDHAELRSLIRAADKQRKDKPDHEPAKLAAVRKVLDRLRRYTPARDATEPPEAEPEPEGEPAEANPGE